MRLFIVEKPSVARAIAEALGTVNTKNKGFIECENNCTVTWCFGHMFTLADPDYYLDSKKWALSDLPIIPTEWKIEKNSNSTEQLEVIEKLLKNADEVVHCGDPDREGQLLIDEVLEEFHFNGKVLRYWANAVDEKTVKNALNNLTSNENYANFSMSAKARSRADWLMGMNETRLFSIKLGELYSVGRVQTPTLKLVYEQDKLIKNFKPIDYFNLKVTFKHDLGFYEGNLVTNNLKNGIDSENRLIDKNVAETILANVKTKTGTVLEIKENEKVLNQPLGLSLADVTSIANAKYDLSAKETLQILQFLYENKFTTYPRTDCKYLPLNLLNDSKDIIDTITQILPSLENVAKNADFTIKTQIWNDGKTTAHHAIIPTINGNSGKNLNENQLKVYEIIARNFLAQFFEKHTYKITEILTQVENYDFNSVAKKILQQGWKEVFDFGEEEIYQKIDFLIQEQDNVLVENAKYEATKTKAPKRFTEGSLIKAMENIYRYIDDPEQKKQLKESDGIGTPATRANIIEELKKREYLKLEKKYLVSTSKAEKLLNFVNERFQSAILTALVERELTQIADGEKSINTFLDSYSNEVSKDIEELMNNQNLKNNSNITCPLCGKSLENLKFNYVCECGVRLPKTLLGTALTEEDIKLILENKSKKYKFVSSKTQKTFEAKLKFDSNSKSFVFDFEEENKIQKDGEKEYFCPNCNKKLIRRKNKNGNFWWGCSGYPDCKSMFFDSNGQPKF